MFKLSNTHRKLFKLIGYLLVFTSTLPGCAQSQHNESEDPFVILAIGQSNMEGRYGSDLDDESVSGKVKAWNLYTQSFEQAQLGNFPFGGNAGGFGGKANNLALRFAIRVHEDTGRPVYIILLAVGGKRIEYFLQDQVLVENNWVYREDQPHKLFGESLSDEIFGDENEAYKALSELKRSKVEVVLIHQGEANVVLGDSEESLIKKYSVFLNELKRMSYMAQSTPVIFGEINARYPNSQNQRQAIKFLSAKSANVSYVKWDGIDEVGEIAGRPGYNNHASGLGLQELGDRYYEQFKNR